MKEFRIIDPYDIQIDDSKLPKDEKLTEEIAAEVWIWINDLQGFQKQKILEDLVSGPFNLLRKFFCLRKKIFFLLFL